jgi:flagellar motor switch protein FliN/FliY
MSQAIEIQSFDTRVGVVPYELPLVAVENVHVTVAVQLGRVTMTVGELLKMGRGSVIMLERKVGEPVEVLVNGRPVARGELVLNDGQLGVTLIEIVKQSGGSL